MHVDPDPDNLDEWETPAGSGCFEKIGSPQVENGVPADFMIGRKGFVGDIKLIASATEDDFLEARNLAKPNETIGSAASRPDMPVKVKAAMRSLLLSTANVPATEEPSAESHMHINLPHHDSRSDSPADLSDCSDP